MARSTDQLLGRLVQSIEAELAGAVALRHHLHECPELAHQELRTAAAVAAQLPVQPQAVAGSGLLARVGADTGPAVAVRAELDGLPIAERTEAPFRARGKVMHACGHDVHMAALVALMRAAQAIEEELPAPLVAVFQPSEEAYPSGAEQLVRGELNPSSLSAIVAAHIHPELEWGSLALDEGAINASSDHVEITIEGEPSHAGYPHHGRDPVLAIAQVVVALHAQVGRRIDPRHGAVVNVGVVEAGEAENLIPGTAVARVSLRARRPQDRAELRAMVAEVALGVAAASGCRATIAVQEGEPVLVNDSGIVARARELLAGAQLRQAPEWRTFGSDDFSFFGELAPIALAFVGLNGAEGFTVRPLHHPELLAPDDAVGAVARAQAVLYLAAATTPRASSSARQRR